MQFPIRASALVDELDRIYPERVPKSDATMNEIQRHAGARELVLFLKQWRDRSREDTAEKRGTRRVRR